MSELFSIRENNNNTFYIKFYPELNSALGCEKATLILGRLEYWFSHQKYGSGFYKFIEPCGHPLYREGDSWSEELGFSRKIFARAFDLIGVRYKSKSAFMSSPDRFQGKLYASYHDRKTNRTYFIRNHEFASQFVKQLFNRKKTSIPSDKKEQKVKEDVSKPKPLVHLKGRSRSSQAGRSSGGTIGGNIIPIQKNTSSLEAAKLELPPSSSNLEQKQLTEEMIRIWKEEVGELGVGFISKELLDRLFASLRDFFEKSLQSWASYCQTISSSKFLMGEAQNKFFKKAWITWAIRKETIEKIRGGGFQLGDRETKHDAQIQGINDTLGTLEEKKRRIEHSLDEIKATTERERSKKVRETIRSFSQDQIDGFKPEFENSLRIERNSITDAFNEGGWNEEFVQTYFGFFLEEKVANQLFDQPLEIEVSQRIKATNLMALYEEVCQDIQRLRHQKEVLLKKRGSEISQTRLFEPCLLAA